MAANSLGSDEIFSFFQETAGKAVQLKVGPIPPEKMRARWTVVPIPTERALAFARLDDENRRKVDSSATAASPTSIAGHSVSGYTNFKPLLLRAVG